MDRRLTLLGRSALLLSLVGAANIACWAIAGLSFSSTGGLTNLALLSWVSDKPLFNLKVGTEAESHTRPSACGMVLMRTISRRLTMRRGISLVSDNSQSIAVSFLERIWQTLCRPRLMYALLAGLWFSLGHSTIVIVVNIAIAISVDLYDKLEGEPVFIRRYRSESDL